MRHLSLTLLPAARRTQQRTGLAAFALMAAMIATSFAFPSSRATANTTLFSDGFESGTLSAWSVGTGGDGSAYVVSSPVKSGTHAARLYASTSSGSLAYIRHTLPTAQASLVAAVDVDVTAEGASGSNVPVLILYGWSGSRIVTLYRQNGTGGQLWLQVGSTYLKTSGIVPLGSWTNVTLQIAPTGTSSATTVTVNGTTVWSATTSLGTNWPAGVQLGSSTGGQGFTEYVDNLSLAIPATTSTSNSPAPTATTSPGWKNVVNDQFGSLTSVPSHWTIYNGRYGDTPGNCATTSHVSVSGGYLHLGMYYQSSGICGAGWYTGGMKLSSTYGSIDQRITLYFRVVNNGAVSHYILPMRWPTTASWPSGGEEDYCERDAAEGNCATFLHYGSNSTTQIYHYFNPDLSQWHTFRAQRLNHVVTIWLDNMSTPVWTYYGNSTTLVDTVKTVVLQQECLVTGCPSSTSGSEDIQIGWITVDNPA